MERALSITDAEAEAALRLRELYREQVAELMDDLDLILTPTVPMVAPPAGIGDLELRGRMLELTFAWNAIGAPALALPCGPAEDGLPASVQLLGKPGEDATVLAAGRVLEASLRPGASASMLRPLVEDLHERRAKAKLGGGEEKIARQHEQDKLTARERLDLLIDDGTFTELGIHAGIHYSVRGARGQGRAGRRRDHRLRQGRRPAGRRVRVRLHGHGRLDGHDRRDEGRAAARPGADQADPVRVAARLGRRADPGGGRLAVRRLRPPVPRGGRSRAA